MLAKARSPEECFHRMGLIRRAKPVRQPPHNADRDPGACGVRRTGLYSPACASLQRGSPNPRAVSANAGDDLSRQESARRDGKPLMLAGIWEMDRVMNNVRQKTSSSRTSA
jgi:hypothetical protein